MKLLTTLLFAASAWAIPVLFPDGQPVPASDPRIGQHVIVTPLTNWRVYANDNPPMSHGNDHDYNDGWIAIDFNADGSGLATWIGSNAAWTDWFTVDGHAVSAAISSAVFAPQVTGSILPVFFYAQNGGVYPTGSHNVMTENITPTPEPGTISLIAAGLMLIYAGSRRKV